MAGQEYWKKVKGEWVNTLALERAERVKKPKTTRGPEIKKPTKKITAYKGGGMAGMRRFNRGGKV